MIAVAVTHIGVPIRLESCGTMTTSSMSSASALPASTHQCRSEAPNAAVQSAPATRNVASPKAAGSANAPGAGLLMLKTCAPELPPPGGELLTTTMAGPAAANLSAG